MLTAHSTKLSFQRLKFLQLRAKRWFRPCTAFQMRKYLSLIRCTARSIGGCPDATQYRSRDTTSDERMWSTYMLSLAMKEDDGLSTYAGPLSKGRTPSSPGASISPLRSDPHDPPPLTPLLSKMVLAYW